MKSVKPRKSPFRLLRLLSTNFGRAAVTALFLLGLWQANPDVDEFLIGAIPTLIGVVWAWGTGAVRESETVERISKVISQDSNTQELNQEVSNPSGTPSEDMQRKILKYLLQKGAITERQYRYSTSSGDDNEDPET